MRRERVLFHGPERPRLGPLQRVEVMAQHGQSDTQDAPEGIREQNLDLQAVLRTMRQPLLVLDGELAVEIASRAFYTTFDVDPATTVARNIYDLGNGQWDIPDLRRLLETILPESGEVADYRVEHDFEGIGRRVMILNACRMERGGRGDRILLSIDDVTARERARWELEAHREYAEKIVDASRDALLVLGWDLRVRTANETFYRVFGVDRSETEGRLVFDLGNGQWNIPELRELLEKVLPGNDAFDDFEVQHEFEGIGRRTMVLNARRIDHMQLILLAIEDQTEARRADAELRNSEARFRAFVAASSDVMYRMSPDGSEMRYFDGRGILSDRAETDAAWMDRHVHPDDRGMVKAEIDRAIAARGSFALEHRVLRADDTLGWTSSRAVPILDEAGELVEWFGTASDISARREAEAALRESEERLSQFGEASSDVLWVRGAESLDWEYLSPAFERIYGIERSLAGGSGGLRTWLDLIVPEDREYASAHIERTARGERTAFEYRIRRPDGEIRWLRDSDFPLFDASGRVVRIGGIGRDTTEERRTSDRMQVLLAELQHRSRNLLGVVQSICGRTLAGSASLDDFRRQFTDRLMALSRVNGLLSRLEDGDRISFDQLLATELKGHGLTAEDGRDPQVELSGPSGISLRSATIQTLALALHELLTNALKHGALSTPEGRLRIDWRLVDGASRLRLEWRETGVRFDLGAEGKRDDEGYGRELIERALPYQLQAETSYELGPDGLHCVVLLPVSSRFGGSDGR